MLELARIYVNVFLTHSVFLTSVTDRVSVPWTAKPVFSIFLKPNITSSDGF